jgi:Recombinase
MLHGLEGCRAAGPPSGNGGAAAAKPETEAGLGDPGSARRLGPAAPRRPPADTKLAATIEPGIYAIAEGLTRDGIPCPSAHDPGRNRHRCGIAWPKSAVRAILTNPRYTGRQVWNRQRKDEVLLDVHHVVLGHTTKMHWNETGKWIYSEQIVHPPIIDASTFQQAQEALAARGRGPCQHKPHDRRRVYAFVGGHWATPARHGRQVLGQDLQQRAWLWAMARCGADGRLPSGKQIASQFGRHERWGRLVKRAGMAGQFSIGNSVGDHSGDRKEEPAAAAT